MEMPCINTNVVPKSQMEAIQTVPPFKMTDPRQVCLVSVTKLTLPGIVKGCLNVVLCYNKAIEQDSGWLVAGWIKESLGRALTEQPKLSGRLRRGDDGELEIVSNDSGIRLLEAKISMGLQDFLDLKDREKAEAELVFWKDIDEQNPQFCPLCYVQVTNFQCGGYSIGISCSMLLADILIMDNFLHKWANIQKDVMSKNEELNKLPIFYLPYLKPPNFSLNSTLSPSPRENSGQTMVFNVTSNQGVDFMDESCKNLAFRCIEEAEQKLGGKTMLSEFFFLVKESPRVLKVENCKKNELVKSRLKGDQVLSSSSLKDYLKINEISFREGNKPARASCWIGSVNDDVVMLIPSSDEDGISKLNFVITVPMEKGI